MDKTSVTYATMLRIFAELVLDESLREHQKKWLYEQIDHALANGDADLFIDLTNELKSLTS